MGADLAAQLAELGALVLGQVGRGGALDDLLVAALDRAVALPQVVEAAVLVAEDLHLDMAGALDHLLQVALAVAEGGLGLAPALAHLFLQLLGLHDGPHAAAAAAPAGLEHEGIADLLGHPADLVHVVGQHLGGRDHRHPGLLRDAAGAGLVAQRAHRLGARADEGDAGGVAGVDEFGVFRQQAIAGVDRVGARHPGDADDLGDREIGRDRPQPLADPVGLVGLEAVQAELVLLGIDRDGALAHLVGRPHDADGDLASVGDEDFLELCHGRPSRNFEPKLAECGATYNHGRCAGGESGFFSESPRDTLPRLPRARDFFLAPDRRNARISRPFPAPARVARQDPGSVDIRFPQLLGRDARGEGGRAGAAYRLVVQRRRARSLARRSAGRARGRGPVALCLRLADVGSGLAVRRGPAGACPRLCPAVHPQGHIRAARQRRAAGIDGRAGPWSRLRRAAVSHRTGRCP